MSNYQLKSGNHHLTHSTNKAPWPNSSIPCTIYNDSSTNKTNSMRNNITHQSNNGQFSHNYSNFSRNGPYNNQTGVYMTTPAFCYNYPIHEGTQMAKNFVSNDKKHHMYDNYEGNVSIIKRPRIEILEKDINIEETNTSEPKLSVAPQIASAISSHKNKVKNHILASDFKDYIKRRNDQDSRNASETYFKDPNLNPELFLNKDLDLPISTSVEKKFTNVESSNYDEEEGSCDSIRENYFSKSLELQNSININQESLNNSITTLNGVEGHINSTSCPLSEFLESDFSKIITSEDFMTGTKDMYKNFVSQFRPVVDGLVDKAKSTKKEDRDSLAMDMWQLGCLENTIRNKVENIDIAEKKLISLLTSLEKRKFILNSIEKTINDGKSKIYKAAEK
uniref:BAG domain-containing protein n=1 Tax=Strongyloides stercoralis TaxID=6248 RepID=A0A913HFF0_STRER